MKTALIALLVVASANAEEFKYDPNAPEVRDAQAKHAAFEQEALALSTPDLFKELQRIDAAREAKNAMLKPEDAMKNMWMFGQSDDDKKSVLFATVLEKRSESGEIAASFYNSVYQWRYCNMWLRQNTSQADKLATECWQKVLAGFKRASEANIGDASSNIARMYANGFGVTPSKFVAAEWYVKAADQYNMRKDRDEALTAVEAALNLVPDHPAALRLRKAMVK